VLFIRLMLSRPPYPAKAILAAFPGSSALKLFQ